MLSPKFSYTLLKFVVNPSITLEDTCIGKNVFLYDPDLETDHMDLCCILKFWQRALPSLDIIPLLSQASLT